MQSYVIGTGVVCVTCLGWMYHAGYFSKVTHWINQGKLAYSLLSKLQESNENSEVASFTINDSDTSATITYSHLGQRYIVAVPYSRSHVAKMIQFKAELMLNKGPLDITQQPGIPYLLSAAELGGHSIRITNLETGLTKDYTMAPMFAEDVIDNE